MGGCIGQGREKNGMGGLQVTSLRMGADLAVSLYEGYAPLLQWPQAKGYSNLRAEYG